MTVYYWIDYDYWIGIRRNSCPLRVEVEEKRSAKWSQDKLGFEIFRIEGHTVFVKPKGLKSLCCTSAKNAQTEEEWR